MKKGNITHENMKKTGSISTKQKRTTLDKSIESKKRQIFYFV